MRAIVVDRKMQPGELRVSEVPEPPLSESGVKLAVEAAGCNFSDVLMLRGEYQERPARPFVPGREAAGRVLEVGAAVSELRSGDRVFALLGTGAFAERAVVDASLVWRMPDDMSFEEGASLPICYPTAYAALVFRAALRSGETLLVHAAAGGTGLAAVQVGKALGARVIATAGGAQKVAVARRAGADCVIDYRLESFVERVSAETEGRGADVVLDPVGGDVFDDSLRAIAWNGRLVVVGFASGRIPELRVNRILLKNIAVVGIHWPAYREREPGKLDEAIEGILALRETGAVRPLISRRYPLERAGEALSDLAARRSVGKLILEP